MNPVIYVFVNKSLGMTAGKLAAQAAHAAAMSMAEENNENRMHWMADIHKTILVMEARDEQHLNNIDDYLIDRGVKPIKIIDEGVNEIDAHTITALATNVLNKDNEQVQQTMSTFKLYRDTIRIKLEIDR